MMTITFARSLSRGVRADLDEPAALPPERATQQYYLLEIGISISNMVRLLGADRIYTYESELVECIEIA